MTDAIAEALRASTAAKKCHSCGCFQDAVGTLEGTALAPPLASVLSDARAMFADRKYDCLGCAICWPADAINAAGALVELPAGAGCPVDEALPREGWPPLPGSYTVLRSSAPVAVCTLHDRDLADALARRAPSGLAIVGPLQTENLGIERLIDNVLANPGIRRIVLCGADTAGAIGHFPGQSLLALVESGVDARLRIVGAKGKRPVLKNLDPERIARFRMQVEIVDRRGEQDLAALAALIEQVAAAAPAAEGEALAPRGVPLVAARPPEKLVLDPGGYLVVFPDAARRRLVAEHYENSGVLRKVIEGTRAVDVMATLLTEGCCTRLDHAAYLGRELTLAEADLAGRGRYVQDRAPEPPAAAVACQTGCGCEPQAIASQPPERAEMKYRIAIVVAVLLAIGGVALAKRVWQPASAQPPAAQAVTATSTVLLFADLREAGEECGCGDVIRTVRSVQGRPGVAIRELDARTSKDEQARYGIKVLPTVLLLGADGAEKTRFEGESEDTVEAVGKAMSTLAGA